MSITGVVASPDKGTSWCRLLDIMLFAIAPMLVDLLVAYAYLTLNLGSQMSIVPSRAQTSDLHDTACLTSCCLPSPQCSSDSWLSVATWHLFRFPGVNNAVASPDRRTSLFGLPDIMLFTIALMLIDLLVACGYLILVPSFQMSIVPSQFYYRRGQNKRVLSMNITSVLAINSPYTTAPAIRSNMLIRLT